MHFGSTEKEPELTPEREEEILAKRVARKTASIEGCSVELQIQKQQIKLLSERIDSLQGQQTTLLKRVEMLQELHAKNMQAMLNGGPTE